MRVVLRGMVPIMLTISMKLMLGFAQRMGSRK